MKKITLSQISKQDPFIANIWKIYYNAKYQVSKNGVIFITRNGFTENTNLRLENQK
ncbi:hypothetical protein KAR91_53500 [Candidatus Pacearchaeota archaeon]|nr:hypothetical protein [Candidatus Pacearchaeota archaeon]